jgi:glycosyltransferase involved in cell wall biosynthesis
MPSVTVLLPVYNGAAYVQRAIASVLQQTYRDFELLIVDDGSTDDTPALLAALDDPRVRVVSHAHNQGLTCTLIEGVQLAQGELLARQDADDWSHPRRLDRQVQFLTRHPQVCLVGTQARVVDERGRARGRASRPLAYPSILWTHLFDNAFVHSSVLVRRSAIEAVGGYDRAFAVAEDFELWSRVAWAGPVANLPERLIAFRRHAASVTQGSELRLTSIEENRRIIARNVRAQLGADSASEAELDLLARYRQGLTAQEVGDFVVLTRRLLRRFLNVWPGSAGLADFRRTLARQHLTLARALARGPTSPASVARSAVLLARELVQC